MKISQASTASGLSAHTIRYYEQCGMLPEIMRTPDGQRDFSPRDVEWLVLLYWLRETGMPLGDMRRFTQLAKAGSETLDERYAMLKAHAEELERRRTVLENCERVLEMKLESYQRQRGGGE